MATTIRLTRMGKKKRPFYRLVVLDSRKRRDGAYLANLGYYNPFVDPQEVDLHTDEILDWLQKGASISDTARSLLKRQGILYHFSLVQQGLTAEEIASRLEAWQPGQSARIQRDADASRARRRQLQEAETQRREAAAAAKAAASAASAAGGEAETPAGSE
ncbi:MAG TPA: 30S ribosomal protein S16 [Candidatus Krumholzibacteria bacterium]|nr:30S ribosomal protein S16 [Candidatus Krumholzibacteria bacterium]HPD71384.1 30S ribosomal protein S16 [Candidatus Krumholzibacteria bacterium]HRY38916.1 30S ribosomal protein S16 [Candidatus Krumholzibacteria bacterium]